MFKEDHLSFRQRKYMKVKNIIGRALGGIGLVVLSPVYLAIIVAIKKEDGITAPVFFSQKRVGIHKEYFNLYKFRSMRTDTPHDKPTHLLENPDQYITKVGHFLRKSSLDELPQLWNIARGDMAVIGPRPALWNQDDLIAERDKYGANDVKPGLTGWAQINGRDELEIPVKARLDGEYVKKMGPLMDIRCFIGTVFSVLRSDGVVEGGTGAKKKLMVITNHSYMLWQFRRELIGKLMEDYDVIISTPFVGHEDDFKAMGCTMIETDVDRRGINPKTDMKLYLTYRRLLKEHHPDMVVTYSIKPNVYAGYACRQMRIPYCVNVQGLGTAFQKKGLREIVIRMYKTALKKAKTVYFENKGNAKVFLQEQIIPSFLNSSVSAHRIRELVELPKEVHVSESEELDPFAEDGFEVLMKDVNFAYVEGTRVITDSYFKACPGEIVALVGPSGEGKTTMIRLILGLIRPQEGEAVIVASNGREIVLNAETRHFFAYVPQGNTILSGTIAENMRMVKEDATDEEIIEALKIACAWDFVEKLPDTINSALGERGRGLSEGQAQRISIARAVLRNAPILLLDEATSALDVTTERKVLRNIIEQKPNKTCIVTTHRPSVLNMCQRVYRVMETKVTELDEEESSRMAIDF